MNPLVHPKRRSQSERILDYLAEGNTLSPAEAVVRFKCMRLAARIQDIKSWGIDVQTEMRKDDNGARYARYSL